MTTYLDALLSQIEDSSLRAELAKQIEGLRDRKQFGLVFEKHLPERVNLCGYPIRPGSVVKSRVSDDEALWYVSALEKDDATLESLEDGSRVTKKADQLVVTRQFGEPVFPGLKSVGAVVRDPQRPFHVAINAENYDALEALSYTHEGEFDLVYLDPPYNTGARDWTYNNDFVDLNDQYRHSKWLSFMEKRLLLTKPLLKEDSVLVVTIDEHEVTRLGVLLRQLFPEAEITMVTIVINSKGVTREGVPRFSRVEEYAFFCFFGDSGISSIGDDLLTDTETEGGAEKELKGPGWKSLLRAGDASARSDRPGMFYPIWIEPDSKKIVEVGSALPEGQDPDFSAREDGLVAIWPIRGDLNQGRWGVGPQKLRQLVSRGFASVGRFDKRRNTWSVSYLSRQIVEDIDSGIYRVDEVDDVTGVATVVGAKSRSRRIKTVWNRGRHNAGVGGTMLVSELVGEHRPFAFPKSVYAVRDTLAMVLGDKPNAKVLDFFGGSGTTAHATMMLNSEDGGNRQCFLVTNNEVRVEAREELRGKNLGPGDREWESEGIFWKATKPRLTAAIEGIRPDGESIKPKFKNADGSPMSDGHEQNIEFLELSYLDPNSVQRGDAFELIESMLWLKAGGRGTRFGMYEKNRLWLAHRGASYAVLLEPRAWRKFVSEISDFHTLTHVFIVTNSLSTFQQISSEISSDLEVSMLYEDYLSNFSINKRGRA